MSCYGVAFRQKVLDFLASGNSKSEASRTFKVCLTAIRSWVKMKEETGSLAPKKIGSPGKRKLDWDKVIAYFEEHPDATLGEAASYFNAGTSTIDKILKKSGFTRKKNGRLQRSKRRGARRL